MLRLGLTGGIGAGKSTVARAFERRGAIVIDADAVAREVVAPGSEGLAEVIEEFGEHLLDAGGALDRPALASVVFRDDDARGRLNAILHPRIGRRTQEILDAAAADAVVVHDVPLLVENGMGPAFALVVVVDAPAEERVRRLGETRGMEADDARARIAAQADHDDRVAAADVWIDNAAGPEAADERVARLWDERIVPFEANLRAGVAVPAPTAVVDPDPDWAAQGRRIAARVATAGGASVSGVEHVGPTAVPDLAAPDLVQILVLVPGATSPGDGALAAALAAAGFPATAPGRHGSADPGRPVDLRILPAADEQATAILGARDAARADPQRVRDDPERARAQLSASP